MKFIKGLNKKLIALNIAGGLFVVSVLSNVVLGTKAVKKIEELETQNTHYEQLIQNYKKSVKAQEEQIEELEQYKDMVDEFNRYIDDLNWQLEWFGGTN